MSNQTEQSTRQLKSYKFAFNFLVSTLAALVITALLGLVIAPFGRWLTNLAIIGGGFKQLCKVTDSDCDPATLLNNPDAVQRTRFVCANDEFDDPSTFAIVPNRGNVRVITWVSFYFSDSGYDPERRCEEVSERFQKFYDRGVLNYITFEPFGDSYVICVALEEGGSCINDGLLFTLKPDENPNDMIDHLFAVRDNQPIGPFDGLTAPPMKSDKVEKEYLRVPESLEYSSENPTKNW